MNKTGAQLLVEALLAENVSMIFAYPGGAVISIFDELYKMSNKIRLIKPRHEQGGTHAADGFARATGKVGVVLVTSGPGATNTVTGIATAYLDSVPMIVITGQVSTAMLGSDAFQEVDIIGMTAPITKANFMIEDITELMPLVRKAFHIARSNRPGPVLIDIPADIQTASIDSNLIDYPIDDPVPKRINHSPVLNTVIDEINKSRRPLILAGGGVNIANANELLNKFINCYRIPVVHTLQGHGLNPDNELYFGGIGMHGTCYGNYAVQKSDLILVFGVRFSDRITGNKMKFAPRAKIIQVDIDRAEIEKNIKVYAAINDDISNVIADLLNLPLPTADFQDWINELNRVRDGNQLSFSQCNQLKPQYLIQLANEIFDERTIVVSDVGQNQMWVAQHYRFRRPRTLLTSGGLGTMGYALPAGIGAKLGSPDKEVLVITGDGGFQMNIQELVTVKEYNINLKILILDNHYLGMVRQWQQLFFEKRYSATYMENPDFSSIAQAIGIAGMTLDSTDSARSMITQLKESREAMVLHAKIEPEENVLPMVAPGAAIDNQVKIL